MTTLFNADNIVVQTSAGGPDSSGDTLLPTLVGEGKKFKDTEALARAKMESDIHIARIEAENKNLRQEVEKRATVEDLLDQIDARTRVEPTVTPSATNTVVPSEGVTTKALSRDEIASIVKQVNLEDRTQASQEQNLAESVSTLQQLWGQGWQTKLIEKRKELGLTEEFMNSIAYKSPKALLSLVGANVSVRHPDPSTFSAPHSASDISRQAEYVSSVRNQAYWDKLRKSDPKLYNSSAMTAERHRIAQKMGKAFFE